MAAAAEARRQRAIATTAAAAANCIATLTACFGAASLDGPALHRAFDDARAAYWGEWPDYLPCDTPYHDLAHALATAELAARLVVRHARTDPAAALDGPHAALTVVLALLHDAGFLRRRDEPARPGAVLAPVHEARSITFVDRYLERTPWAALAPRTASILGTRLDAAAADLPAADATDLLMFRLVGSADLLAQLADPLYLERCRDFLYAEFALAGLDYDTDAAGRRVCRYRDGNDLLRQTGAFVRALALPRLDTTFGGLWRILDAAEIADHRPEAKRPDRAGAAAAIARNLARLDDAVAAGDLTRIAGQPQALLP